MKREVGSTAGILAILAVALHALFPTGSEKAQPTPKVEKQSSNFGNRSGGDDEPRDGPWLATRAYFAPTNRSDLPEPRKYPLKNVFDAQPIPAPERGDLVKLFAIPDTATFYSVVATVPDPLHTRMASGFDAAVEAIERAAERQGWAFARQWLPWQDPASAPEDDISERRHQRRLEREQEDLPGLLIFRSTKLRDSTDVSVPTKTASLFVFLVPESPTGAIATAPFYAALNFSSLSGDGKTPMPQVGLLAPFYSGSFRSLWRALDAWGKDHPGIAIAPDIFGGSISDRQAASDFVANMNGSFAFHSGVASSSDYLNYFEGHVLGEYSAGRDQAAYFVEEESGFSAGFVDLKRNATANDGKDGTPAPLNIYRFPRDISHLRNAYRDAARTTGSASPSVEFTLKDPTRGEDSIPTFSETGKAIEQSSALDLVIDQMRSDGIKLVYLAATNNQDLVFITQLLRRQSPDIRIVIGSEPDPMFLPAAAQDDLVGTPFLSTYPFFYEGEDWLAGKRVRRAPFSPYQGLTRAAQLLFQEVGAKRSDAAASIQTHPGLWLLTMTHAGWLPLDWDPLKSGEASWFQPLIPAGTDQRTLASWHGEPTLGWYVTFYVSSMLAFLWSVTLFGANWREAPEALVLCYGDGVALATTFGVSVFSALAPSGLILPALDAGPPTLVLAIAGIVVAAPLLSWFASLVVSPFGQESRRGEAPSQGEGRGASTFYFLIVALAAISLGGAWLTACGFDPGRSYATRMFRFRALDPFSGVSPTLPPLIMCAIFAAGFLVLLMRRARGDRPKTPREFGPEPKDDVIWQMLGGPFGSTRKDLPKRSVFSVGVAGLCVAALWGRVRVFDAADTSVFATGCFIAGAVLIAAIVSDCHDLCGLWIALKDLLVQNEVQWVGPIRKVVRHWPRQPVLFLGRSASPQLLDALIAQEHKPSESARTQDISETAIVRAGHDELHYEARRTVTATTGQSADNIEALMICKYLIVVTKKIHLLAWGLTAAFLALILVLNSYPLQAPQFVGRFCLVAFAVVSGIGIWVLGGMERNRILSLIARSDPGKLNAQFWVQIMAMGILPTIAVLSHLFPSLATFLTSWVAPSVNALE